MPVKIQLKNSTVKNRQPDPATLDYGELCVSHHEDTPALYFKSTTNALIKIQPDANVGHGPDAPGTGNEEGDLWWDGNNLLVWNGSSWVITGARDLEELEDVVLTTPANGEVLMFNGSTWVNVDPSSVAIDVDLAWANQSATTGQVTNTAGDDATLTSATNSLAGLQSAADKAKLDGIADGAEVNVKSDWNASSGDAEILNKPELFSGDYDDLTNKPDIPEKTSELTNDGDGSNPFATTDQLFSGDYDDLNGTPTIPDKLGDLSDVNVGSAANGNILSYNGSNWVNTSAPPADISGSSIGQLSDVDTTGAADGKILQYDSGEWVVADPPSGNAGTVTSIEAGDGLETDGDNPITGAGVIKARALNATITVNSGGIAVTPGTFFPAGGGELEGVITTPEKTITSIAFDLSEGPFWECGSISVPNPTNAVAGMSGLIRFTGPPTDWGFNFKFAGGTPVAPSGAPSVSPFYVRSATEIYVGPAVEGLI